MHNKYREIHKNETSETTVQNWLFIYIHDFLKLTCFFFGPIIKYAIKDFFNAEHLIQFLQF